MRGGFLHNDVMVADIAKQFALAGAHSTTVEVPVRCGQSTRFIDLLIRIGGRVICIEVELTDRRIAHDIDKAKSIDADELWIIAPNADLLSPIRHRIRSHGCAGLARPRIIVLTFGQALKRIHDCFSLMCEANTQEKQISGIKKGDRPIPSDQQMNSDASHRTGSDAADMSSSSSGANYAERDQVMIDGPFDMAWSVTHGPVDEASKARWDKRADRLAQWLMDQWERHRAPAMASAQNPSKKQPSVNNDNQNKECQSDLDVGDHAAIALPPTGEPRTPL